ncbi:hypothetical protein DM860_015467 [Cuscuta australis]|uniref:Uncharacterized protein n=1 Tax=Cuscuta australis TaxID=267555 RepID=A0A328EAV6_9ASTE|nr:hypothetical protein DM860_015467 [Cuscuta australis]
MEALRKMPPSPGKPDETGDQFTFHVSNCPYCRLKLNFDASFTRTSQRGAAILRDSCGKLTSGASFQLQALSPFQEEVEASTKGMNWATDLTNDFIVEPDAWEVYTLATNFIPHRTSPFPIDSLGCQLLDHNLPLIHTLREGKGPADILAKEDRSRDEDIILYPEFSIRQDFVPSFRFDDP